jgi:mevalonate kinase
MKSRSQWSATRFEASVSGKWVLTGEHAVLRGACAVAMPHPETALKLCFEPTSLSFSVEPEGLAPVILGLFEAAGLEAPESGRLDIRSTIPFGAGLGSSAALCVAFTQWVSGMTGLPGSERTRFATRLEDFFHGRSSGMDVAVLAAGEPVAFARASGARTLGLGLLPRFTFHDTGLRARTSDCVAQVQAFGDLRPADASSVDNRMASASELAIAGLRLYDRGERRAGLKLTSEAMNLAHRCFVDWGLAPPEVLGLREELLSRGALAVKLTGAGGGGFVVALWD